MVWSHPEIIKLSREFVAVADEAYMLYPENPDHLNRAKDNPAHQFFSRFGEQVPPPEWNLQGTKQGIYIMGPDAEYLEAKFASSNAADILARMKRALERWETLRKEKSYANQPVPHIPYGPPPSLVGNRKFVLQVNLRDLPRGGGDRSGARFENVGHMDEPWFEFSKWAWNQNWISFDDPRAFVTSSEAEVAVASNLIRRIAMEVLVDNVRGQAPTWRTEHVKKASLTMRRFAVSGDRWSIEYRGAANMDAGAQGFSCSVYGQAVWNEKEGKFESFDLVAIGDRRGAWRFNNRERDPGPAPMGVAISVWK